MEVLGLALSSRGDAGAKPALEKAVALNSHAFAARVELAKLLKKESKPTEAAQRLEEALAVRFDLVAERGLAELRSQVGDLVGAQKAMDSVLGGPTQPDATTLLLAARIAAVSGEPAAAERLLTQAVGRGARPWRANRIRAQASIIAGKYKDAVTPALAAVMANPEDAEARSLYALATEGTGRPTRARLFLRSSFDRLGFRTELLVALAQIDIK